MVYLKLLRQSKGQTLVEAALVAPLIIVFLFVIVWFARVTLTWQQISTAARYGTDLIAYTPFSQKYIERDIKDYLCNPDIIGRILDPEKLDIKIEINDYKPVKYDNLSSISRLGNLRGLIPGFDKKSFVEIKYSYKIPRVLKITGKKNIEIKARSEVLSGSGSQSASRRQE
ncbi:hypothetical protein AGMMS49950_05110 [Endomicrobiia bacterium]|nr:hypothetical protein AGMMS49950_05110 [Endomicrobiia bacterium]